MNAKNRVFVIGIDGATFDIIKPMLEKGKLPHISALMRRGSVGPLTSCIPDLSPPAWTSLMTGVHPGKHGVLDFFGHVPKSYDLTFFNASFRKTKPLWTLLSEAGKKVCVINVPLSFPPDKVNGVLISGMDTPDIHSDFIYPPSLRAELDEQTGGYLMEKAERNMRDSMMPNFIDNLFKVTGNRFETVRYLMKKDDWDFFIVVFEATDRAQHQAWKYMDPGHPSYTERYHKKYGTLINDTYEDMDAKLGELIAMLPDSTSLFVVSDHGFGPLYKGVRLNKWLESKSYSRIITSYGKSVHHSVISQLKRIMPKGVKLMLTKLKGADKKGASRELKMLDCLDMTKTRVYPMGGNGNLFINVKGRQPFGIVSPGKEYDDLRDEIIESLKDLKDPENGNRMIDAVYKRENVYSTFPEHAPDILIRWARGYSFIGERELAVLGIRDMSDTIVTRHRWSGNHRPEGILFMDGANIKEHGRIKGAKIVDIAPTILALLSTDIPDDMDGRVLTEAITESFLDSKPISYKEAKDTDSGEDHGEKAYSDDESETIGQRLRNLGYIE